MDNRQQRTLDSLAKVLDFLDTHGLKPTPPLLTAMRTSLDTSMKRIQDLHVQQLKSERRGSGVTNLTWLRTSMRRERMMPLVRIAKPLLKFAPGTEAALRVPHARADALTVANAALKLADALKPHTKLLVSAGYTKDFLREFRHEARVLALAAKASDQARQRRARATASIATEFKKAMGTVTVIEGILMPHFARDRALERIWRNRRRVSARIGRPRARGVRPRPRPATATFLKSLEASPGT